MTTKSSTPVPPEVVTTNGQASAGETNEATKGDVYDNLDRLRRRQTLDVRPRQPKEVTVVKRPRQFFRTNPDPTYTMIVMVLEYGPTDMDKEIYLVDPDLWTELEDEDESRDAQLFLIVNPDNNPFVWPVKLPRDEDSRGASWSESARIVADQAKREWIKIKGNKVTGKYVATPAVDDLGDPEWPTDENGAFSFAEVMRKAFGTKHYVDTLDHPVVKKIQGRVS